MIARLIKSKKNELAVFLVVLFLSLIPVFYTWGRLPIGGDVLIPFNSDGLEKYLYQWNAVRGGEYVVLNIFPLYLFYKICEFFKLNIYQISSLMFFFLNFIAGTGIYWLVKLFGGKEHFSVYTLPIIFYLLSPALLNSGLYNYTYFFSPWFVYFIFKTIKSKQLKLQDLMVMSFLFSFLSIDLPNPKYIFHLGVISLAALAASLFLKLADFKFILKNFGKLIVFFLLTAYLLLPLFYFALGYSPELYGVKVKETTSEFVPMADYGTATINKMVRLHQDGMNMNAVSVSAYNSLLIVSFLAYLPIILITAGLLFINNRYYLIFTFLTICFLFFAIGPNRPTGPLYVFLVSNLKHLAFLRTTAGAVFFLSIFYSVLLAFILKRFSRINKKIVLLVFLSLLIISYPFLNGDYYENRGIVNPYTDTKQYGLTFPENYFEVKETVESLKKDAKVVFSDPGLGYINTNWGFFGFPIYNFLYNTHNIGYNDVLSNLANHNVGLVYYDESLFDSPPVGVIAKEEKFVPLKQSWFIKISKVKDEYFLPHFYIPQNVILTNEDVKNSADVISFGDYQIRSGIYFDTGPKKAEEEISAPQEKADEIFIKAGFKDEISERWVWERKMIQTGFAFPYVRHRPGSFTHPLILQRERFNEWWVRKNTTKLIEKKLFYASKRIAEIDKYGSELSESLILKTKERYQAKMEKAIRLIEEMAAADSQNSLEWEINILKLARSWQGHKEKISEIGLLEDWATVLERLDEKIESLEKKPDFKNLKYGLEIPEEGEYELLIKIDKQVNEDLLAQMSLTLDKVNVAAEERNFKEGQWFTFGDKYFSKGNHELVLHLPEPENLVGDGWQSAQALEIQKGGIKFFLQEIFPETQNLVFQKINNWQENAFYYLTFDYKTKKGFLIASILEDKFWKEKNIITTEKIFTETLETMGAQDWKKFEMFFKTDNNSKEAKLYFYGHFYRKPSAESEFKNLKIYKIVQPKVVLRKKVNSVEQKFKTPQITFVKVNPTKYKVLVEEATEPYFLIFSENFHRGWKAYIQTAIAKFQADGNIVASYFDGEIKEGRHQNSFFDKAIFGTWGEKAIPEERHLLVNGYANSWHILPEDANGNQNYELIIEFQPQKSFYLGFLTSTVAFLGCLVCLGYDFARKNKLVKK